MLRQKLEGYLQKKVTLQLFDGSTYTGYLRKTEDNAFAKVVGIGHRINYYVLTTTPTDTQVVSCLFRCSHVTSIH